MEKTIILQGITIEEFNQQLTGIIDQKLAAFADKYIPDRLLKANEACEELGVCFNTLKSYVNDGLINPVNRNGSPRYSFRELIKVKEIWQQH